MKRQTAIELRGKTAASANLVCASNPGRRGKKFGTGLLKMPF